MTEFLLKASFISGLAWLFYKGVLQQESFFTANRFFLLAAVGLAFILPLIALPPLVNHQGILSTVFEDNGPTANLTVTREKPFPKTTPQPAGMPKSEKPATPVTQTDNASTQAAISENGSRPFSWIFWLEALYLFGVAIFTGNLLFQLGSIGWKVLSGQDKIYDKDCVIVNTPDVQAPCSFFRYIFICPEDYDYATYEQIIEHEKIHVRQQHTLDLLLAELAVIVLWFNPLIWLLKNEIEKNIEYQTDSLLLAGGQVSKNEYQLSLVQIAAPHKPLAITTNYNQSLLKQRILMMNAKKSNLHSYWKYAFVAPLLFGALLLLNPPAESRTAPNLIGDYYLLDKAVATPATTAKKTPTTQNDDNMSSGFWYSYQQGDNYCLEFKGAPVNGNRGHWNMTRCLAKSLFQKQGNNVFQLTRETGTLELTGKLDDEVSQGKYVFTKNAGFEEYLRQNNITHNDQNFMFHLFMADVNRQYVDFLKQQYNQVEGERLMEVAIHGISMQDYQAFLDLFQKYSNTKPPIEKVIEARIHGISEAYVKELQAAGFTNLSLDKMMETKIHGVDTKYIEGLRSAGYKNLTIDEVRDAKIHGITPAAITEMQSLGYGNLSLEKMMEVRIHGVNAAYIEELKAAGLNDLSLDQLVEAKIHGLSQSSIQDMQRLGFKDLSFRKMVDARIHGITPSYLEELKKAGFTNLSIDEVIEAKIHGLSANRINELQAMGFGKLSLNKMKEASIHGVNGAYLNELKAAGFQNLELDQVIQAKIHGVDGDFIREAQQKGYKLQTLEEYVQLKMFDMARRSK